MTSKLEVSKRTQKVLIADDDPGIARFLRESMHENGFPGANGEQWASGLDYRR